MKLLLILILCLCVVPLALSAACQSINITHTSTSTDQNQSVKLLSCVEFDAKLASSYANPFDFDEVHVFANISAKDAQKRSVTVTIDGFYFQEYSRSLKTDELGEPSEHLEPIGKPHWRLRFTPIRLGTHAYSLYYKDKDGLHDLQHGEFVVESASHDGFVRVASRYHFGIDHDGGPFFAVGENVCWPDSNGTYDYDEWFGKLTPGSNYARLWTGVIGFDIEPNLGRYDLESLWRLDYVLNLANSLGMRLMFTLDSFNSLRISQPYPAWDQNPYNKKNGGMLDTPQQFFTSNECRMQYWKRLRYMVSRYAYSPYLFSWELWNEVDITEKPFNTSAVTQWHKEAARFVKGLDVNEHLITTSFSFSPGIEQIDSLPEMDYTQTHSYGSSDMAKNIHKWNTEKTSVYGKPHIVGEFGLDLDVSLKNDKHGIALHNGLWSAIASQGAGTAMNWWWDNYIDPDNLYSHIIDASKFAVASGIRWLVEESQGELEWSASVDLISANGTKCSDVDVDSSILRVYGVSTNQQVVFWAQDRRNIWSDPQHKYVGDSDVVIQTSVEQKQIDSGTVDMKCLCDGVQKQVEASIGKDGALKAKLPFHGAADIGCYACIT